MPQQQPGEQASGQPAPGGWGGVKAAVGRSFAQLGLEPADLPPAFLLHELLGLTIAAGLWTACYSFAPVRRLAASVAGGKSPALRGAAAARLQRAQDAAMAKAAQAVRRMSWLRKGADPARLTASLAESLVIGWAIKPVTWSLRLWASYQLVQLGKASRRRRRREGRAPAAGAAAGGTGGARPLGSGVADAR